MKKLIYVLLLVLGILLIDTTQALIFNNPPLIGIETRGMKKEGVLVDTYLCKEHKNHTVFKGVKFSCHVMDYVLVDKTKEIDGIACDSALYNFYEDDNYIYYWDCCKDEYMVVRYVSGAEITIGEALKSHYFDIQELDAAGIQYVKYEKQKEQLKSPPDLYLYLDGDSYKAKALIGSHSWSVNKGILTEVVEADSLHPSQMTYHDNNILKYNNATIHIESVNALISSVNIYDINKTDEIKKINYTNISIMLGYLKKGDYALEIIAEYTQGTVCYGVKIRVE